MLNVFQRNHAKRLVQKSVNAVAKIEKTAQDLLSLNGVIEQKQKGIKDHIFDLKTQHDDRLAALHARHTEHVVGLDDHHRELQIAKERNARVAERFMRLVE